MRAWIDPDKLAEVNLAPGDVHAALRRNNYLAAVGRTKGNLVQVNLLANTDLRSPDEFKDLIVSNRNGAVVKLRDVATVELGSEEPDFIAKYNANEAVYMGVWPLPGTKTGRGDGKSCGNISTASSRVNTCRRNSVAESPTSCHWGPRLSFTAVAQAGAHRGRPSTARRRCP